MTKSESGDWKVVQRSKDHQGRKIGFLPIELCSLKNDPVESHDLAAQHPEIVEKLERLMEKARTSLH